MNRTLSAPTSQEAVRGIRESIHGAIGLECKYDWLMRRPEWPIVRRSKCEIFALTFKEALYGNAVTTGICGVRMSFPTKRYAFSTF